MRKNRKQLYVGHRLGLHGRLMRDGEAQGGDNGGAAAGNSGGAASGGSESNNTGDGFDPASFWGSSESSSGQNPSGESASDNSNPNPGSSEGQSLQEILTGRLESMTFGDPVFTAEVTQQINEGNFDGFHQRLDGALRGAVRESLGMMVQVLRPFAEQINQTIEERLSSTLTNRDNAQALESLFPGAKNPAVRPMIQSIYDQALKNTKGNREAAVKQTKEMLKHAAGITADDLDISVHARGADDSGRPANPTTNWLDELTER